MKKLFSILLAVAMLATMAFAVSAADGNMLPPSASDFSKQEGDSAGKGTITVTAEGDGYKFVADQGWPNAYYVDEACWLYVNEADDVYLNYDFEVKSGAANIIIYFAGQSPTDQASPGSFVCLNGLIDPSYVNSMTGDAVVDVPVGKYSGSVKITDLGYREDLKDDQGNMLFSGCKIFAVGGEVVVNTLNFGTKEAEVVTTQAGGNTATTTKAQSGSSNKNPNTGDTEVFALTIVVLAAAAVVTLSAVSKKAKSR